MWYTVRHVHFLSNRLIPILQWLSLVIDYHVLLPVRFCEYQLSSECLDFYCGGAWWVFAYFLLEVMHVHVSTINYTVLLVTNFFLHLQAGTLADVKDLDTANKVFVVIWVHCNSITWEKYYNKESEFWRFVAIKPSFKVPASDTPNKVDCRMKDCLVLNKYNLSNTKNTKVIQVQWSIFDEHQGVLKIMSSNTVLCVWYIFSIETKNKEKTEKYNWKLLRVRCLKGSSFGTSNVLFERGTRPM